MSAPALLEVKNLRLSFAGKEVVGGVGFSLVAGEKLALIGESGSGKTVTALSLLGLAHGAAVQGQALFATRAAGTVDLLGLPEPSLRDIRGRDIAMIFQEPMTALNPLLSVGRQIAEVLELKNVFSKEKSMQEAIDLIAMTGISQAARRARDLPHQLSGGQRQRIMVAMALAGRPQLLLADEPTTALDASLRGQILDLLDQLQQRQAMAVLMITHDLHLVRRFADRVAVMENGCIVEQGSMAEIFAQPQHPYTRKLLSSRPSRAGLCAPAEPVQTEAPLIQASNLCASYAVPAPGWKGWFARGQFVALQGASFTLERGQTLGVMGGSGSGKSTLALVVLGLLPFTGQLQLMGQAWHPQSAKNKTLRRAVQVVFQDPFSSLSPRMTVEEIVGEGLRVHEPRWSVVERRQRVLEILAEVGLHEADFPTLLQRYPHAFSGGQRQRLALARALIVQPDILVLDEPTSALDVTVQKQVLELLQRIQAKRGLSYLLITHDVDVIGAMAHQVMVMQDAKVIEFGSAWQVLQEPVHPYTQALVKAGATAAV